MESAPGHTPLIHGLPDEIALICLARVPRRYHNVLRRVSKRWRALLCSEEWHLCRKRNNLDESWVYVICREAGIKCYVLAPDPSSRCFRIMHIIEPPCSGRKGVTIEALDKRLFLLGGCSCVHDATDEVYCYDASSNRWRGTENEIALCCSSPTVVVDGTLYMLEQSMGTKLMRWQNDTKEWATLGRLSDKVTRPPCALVAIGKKIHVIGRGLSIVTVDVDTAARVDGFLITTSVGPLVEEDLTPERCMVITI